MCHSTFDIHGNNQDNTYALFLLVEYRLTDVVAYILVINQDLLLTQVWAGVSDLLVRIRFHGGMNYAS